MAPDRSNQLRVCSANEWLYEQSSLAALLEEQYSRRTSYAVLSMQTSFEPTTNFCISIAVNFFNSFQILLQSKSNEKDRYQGSTGLNYFSTSTCLHSTVNFPEQFHLELQSHSRPPPIISRCQSKDSSGAPPGIPQSTTNTATAHPWPQASHSASASPSPCSCTSSKPTANAPGGRSSSSSEH
jgi:hypothetical protein